MSSFPGLSSDKIRPLVALPESNFKSELGTYVKFCHFVVSESLAFSVYPEAIKTPSSLVNSAEILDLKRAASDIVPATGATSNRYSFSLGF